MPEPKKVSCLYLEDRPDDRDLYKYLIELAWERLETGIPISVVPFHSPTDAIREIKTAPDKYDLFVADLLFGSKEEELGLTAIAQVRNLRKLAILALSGATIGLEERARGAGADDFYSKVYQSQHDAELAVLGHKLLSILAERKPELFAATPIPEHVYKRDLHLAALIDEIGAANLSTLVTKVVRRRSTAMTPSMIRPGLSGAAVLRIEADLEVPPTSPPEIRSLLLKISRDRDALNSEVEKRESLCSFPTGLFVPFHGDLESSGKWWAIGAQFQDAATLCDWISTRPITDDRISSALSALFLGSGGLSAVYGRCTVNPGVSGSEYLWEKLGPGRRARIQAACADLSGLARKHATGTAFSVDLVQNFITETKAVGAKQNVGIPLGVTLCLSHGDLHTRNILIDANDHPSLIDPANIGPGHWAADVARLSVDLLVAGLDPGDESHEWAAVNGWVATAAAFIRDQPLPAAAVNSPNSRVRAALEWIRSHLRQLHADAPAFPKPEWGFRLAVATEFMKASYKDTTPTPKRVFALVSACDALSSAGALIP